VEAEMAEEISHVITMVHGTFAKNAQWTTDHSPLCNALRQQLGSRLLIRPFPWSGANRNLDRIEASKKLAKMLHEDIARYPKALQFVVGHSHGGNVALYALRDTSLQDKLHGIICINTPFLSVTKRNVEQLFFGLQLFFIGSFSSWLAAVMLLFFQCFLMSVGAIIGGCGSNISWMAWPLLLALIVAFVVITIIFSRWAKYWFIKSRERDISNLALPIIRAPKVLSIWSAGDEVFSVFSVLEGIANIPYLFFNAFSIVVLLIAGVGASFVYTNRLHHQMDDWLREQGSVTTQAPRAKIAFLSQ
jgi:hypothetical protein